MARTWEGLYPATSSRETLLGSRRVRSTGRQAFFETLAGVKSSWSREGSFVDVCHLGHTFAGTLSRSQRPRRCATPVAISALPFPTTGVNAAEVSELQFRAAGDRRTKTLSQQAPRTISQPHLDASSQMPAVCRTAELPSCSFLRRSYSPRASGRHLARAGPIRRRIVSGHEISAT